MKNTLLVVADLGGFKAYKIQNNEHLNRTPRLELLEHFDNPDAKERLVEKVTDQAGRFSRGAQGAMSSGEAHNLQLEIRKRFVRQLAQRLNTIGRNEEFEALFLAASKEINHQLLDELEPRVRAKIEKNLPADFSKLQPAELLSRF
jgi:hypothetical protein